MKSTDWIKQIQEGDVLRSGSGVLRVVRAVEHWGESINRTSVTFSILHCSWTRRPYTILNGCALTQQGYEPTDIRGYPLNTRLDRALDYEIHGVDGRPPLGDERKLFCCDVRGIT